MACGCAVSRKAEGIKRNGRRSVHFFFIGLAAAVVIAAAAEDNEKRDDDEPYALVVKNIAKAVIHKFPPKLSHEVCVMRVPTVLVASTLYYIL